MKISAPAATVKVPIVIVAVFGSLAAASPDPTDAPDELVVVPPPAPPPEVATVPPPPLAFVPLEVPALAPLPPLALSPLGDAPPEDSALPPAALEEPELFEPEEPHARAKLETKRAVTRQIFIGGSPCPETPQRGDIGTEIPRSQDIRDGHSDGYFTGNYGDATGVRRTSG
jgi:hypothetical protein